MKVIRISDALHKYLKEQAQAEGRTLQWYVENKLIDGKIEETGTSKEYLEPVIVQEWT